jgi:EAL domain-containing protein (putative c-di-GMP-specific phosphodiesterase class I)
MKLSDLYVRQDDEGCYAAVWGPFMLKSGFQPIFRIGEGPAQIAGFEALCRPLRGDAASSPGQFFSLVPSGERYRVELQTRAVHVLNAPPVLIGNEWLFLNFDPSMFGDQQSVDVALDILSETLKIAGIEYKRVVCEVTEHKTAEANLMMLVTKIRTKGFKIAVDDYGSDSSDMERVHKLSPDIVKFDARWITRMMDSGPAGSDLLKDMVKTFKARNILTVFEGIEHGWQLDMAVDCCVEFVQGYVLARPQTVPANFQAFRAKQNVAAAHAGELRTAATPLPLLQPGQPLLAHKGLKTGFEAWEREISTAMDKSFERAETVQRARIFEPVAQTASPQAGFAQSDSLEGISSPDAFQDAAQPAFGRRGTPFGKRRPFS